MERTGLNRFGWVCRVCRHRACPANPHNPSKPISPAGMAPAGLLHGRQSRLRRPRTAGLDPAGGYPRNAPVGRSEGLCGGAMCAGFGFAAREGR